MNRFRAIGRDPRYVAAVLIPLAFCLMCLAWAGGSPLGAAPDEPAHFVKAYATAVGQISGEPALPAQGQSIRDTWFAKVGRFYVIPKRLRPPTSVLCYAFDPNRTPACQTFDGEPKDQDAKVSAFTHLATYNPFPYVVTGFVVQAAPDFQSAMRRGRLASALACTLFVGWAALLLQRRGRFALLGLVLALTPSVVFVSASLNTSGLEVVSAICFWSALIALGRESNVGPGVWAAIGTSGVTLALTRPLGAVMIPIVLVTVAVLVGPARLRAIVRSVGWCGTAPLVAIMLACGLSVLWGHFVIPHPSVDFGVAYRGLGPALRDLPNQARDVIGIFGYNNTPMPMIAYVLALILLGGLGGLSLILGKPRERIALFGLALAAGTMNVALAVLVEAQIGFGMQARYVMPLVVGFMLMAGDIVQRHDQAAEHKQAAHLVIAGGCGAALLQLTAFAANQHRYGLGLNAGWRLPWHTSWSPVGGTVIWLIVAATACLLLITAAVLMARARSPVPEPQLAHYSQC